MEYQKFFPEGWNSKEEYTFSEIEQARLNGKIIEGTVINCDENFNLHVSLGNNLEGIVPKNEIELAKAYRADYFARKEQK